MSTEHAYSTDNPETVEAYRRAVEKRNAFGKWMRTELDALGAGPRVFVRSSGMSGDKQQLTAIEQSGDHIPEGWRIVRGNLEPRRGKPGQAARQWLADHQPVDVRHVLEGHGLPRSCWIPASPGSFSFRIVTPELFEHDGVLWACFDAEPGVSDSGFDDKPCTWMPRKLSEFHAARDAAPHTRTDNFREHPMSTSHRPSYVALIAALRAEFNVLQLESLDIQTRQHRYDTSSLGVLAQAVRDAGDVMYDTPRCQEPTCPDFGDPDFGEATCPAEHATGGSRG